jgi:hypothetical protein
MGTESLSAKAIRALHCGLESSGLLNSALMPTNRRVLWLLTLTLIILWGLILSALVADSLWGDEVWSAWAIQPASIVEMLARVQADVHPPFYFVLLWSWAKLAGSSEFSLRILSAWAAALALAGTYTLGKRLVDWRAAWMAVILLGTSGFFLNYAREARMYSLLVLLVILSTWAYHMWLSSGSQQTGMLYALLCALCLYIHYHGVWILVVHGLHAMLFQPRRTFRWAGWLAVAGLLYLPWIPFGYNQFHTHPRGPFAVSIPTRLDTLSWLIRVLTSDTGWLIVLPVALAFLSIRQKWQTIGLLVIWLIAFPAIIFALNAWLMPLYQVRYVIAILPAGALLVALGLRQIKWQWVTLVGLAGMVVMQLRAAPVFWPHKPAWRATLEQVVAARALSEPLIIDADAINVVSYYSSQLPLRQGKVVDLADQTIDDVKIGDTLRQIEGSEAVWAILPSNAPASWDLSAALDSLRHPGYRASLGSMVFYRFDAGNEVDLHFRFGDWVDYDGTIGKRLQFAEPLCAEVRLTSRDFIGGEYSAGIHLVDETGTSVEQWDNGIGILQPGDQVVLSPCISLPRDLPPGRYHLQMNIYNWSSLVRLPVMEDSAYPAIYWGDTLVIAAVAIP